MVYFRFIDHWTITFHSTFFDSWIIINLFIASVSTNNILHIDWHTITNRTFACYHSYGTTNFCSDYLIILVGNLSHYVFSAIACRFDIVIFYFNEYVLRYNHAANLI